MYSRLKYSAFSAWPGCLLDGIELITGNCWVQAGFIYVFFFLRKYNFMNAAPQFEYLKWNTT